MQRLYCLLWISLLQCLSVPILVIELGNDSNRGAVVDLSNPNTLAVVDIVIDEQSERRQPAVVGFQSLSELVFGHEAEGLYYRTGKLAVPSVGLRLLGATAQTLEAWKVDFGSHHSPSLSSSGVVFPAIVPAASKGEGDVSVNELIALQLQHYRQLGDAHLKQTGQFKEPITKAVLVVPANFSASQRALYKQLAAAAGLTVDIVVGDLTAAAVDYATRNSEACDKKDKFIFYTLGAYGASAQLVQFGWTDNKIAKVTELGSAFDASVGGAWFTSRLRDILLQKFAPTKPVSAKAEAKLLRAAVKAKLALSVGPKAQVNIDEFSEGRDLKTELTVDDFNDALKDRLTNAFAPIQALLGEESGVTGIEMVGGGWRVPAVKRFIEQSAGSVPVGRHVDADEGILMGASTLAAMSAAEFEGKAMPSHLPGAQIAAAEKPNPVVNALSASELAAIGTKLSQWQARMNERQKAEVARNQLQSLINELGDLLTEGKKLPADLRANANQILEQSREFFAQVEAGGVSSSEIEEKTRQIQTVHSKIDEINTAEAAKKEAKAEKEQPQKNRKQDAQKQRDRDYAIKKGKEDKEKRAAEAAKRAKSAKAKKEKDL